MGVRGPKPKSAQLINIQGNAHQHKPKDDEEKVDWEPISECPPPPKWLPNAYALDSWNKIAPQVFAKCVMTDANADALGVLCGCFGRIAEAFAQGLTPNIQVIAQYRSLINDFGFTPTTQGKVRALKKTEVRNPFLQNGRRAA